MPKRTIALEREIIKDNFRAYSTNENMFHTLNDYETLMRKSLENNEDVDVCPTCFNVYQYL